MWNLGFMVALALFPFKHNLHSEGIIAEVSEIELFNLNTLLPQMETLLL